MDTIYAETTPPGRGGVSIVRLSGPGARAIGEGVAGALPEARQAVLRSVRDGDVIDRALVIRFDPGASFTGEEVVEFHLHGAPVVVRRLMSALRARGARLAEPGEFTRRGFLNGVVPLSEAEALSDLLVAETEAQRVRVVVDQYRLVRTRSQKGLGGRELRPRAGIDDHDGVGVLDPADGSAHEGHRYVLGQHSDPASPRHRLSHTAARDGRHVGHDDRQWGGQAIGGGKVDIHPRSDRRPVGGHENVAVGQVVGGLIVEKTHEPILTR